MKGWAYEVTTAGDRGTYSRNALVFATKEAADAYGLDLTMRWTAVIDGRAIEVDEVPNYEIVDGAVRRLEGLR